MHDIDIARTSALSLYMTPMTPYANTMAGSAIRGRAKAAVWAVGVRASADGHGLTGEIGEVKGLTAVISMPSNPCDDDT